MQSPEHPMKAEQAFRRFLDAQRLEVTRLSPEAGIRSVLEFYRTTRFDSGSTGSSDTLLFQWGTYDWGDGLHFEFDLTRQFRWPSSDEEDEIWQLSLTFKFEPDNDLRALRSGDRWCEAPGEIVEFEKYFKSSAALRAVATRAGPRVALSFGSVE